MPTLNKKQSYFIRNIFLIFLSICLLITGCQIPSSNGKDYSAYSQENTDNKQITSDFNTFTDNIFKEEVVSDTISLHYILSNPSSYGITNYPITFGNVSNLRSDKEKKENMDILEKLHAFSYDTLNEEQKVTYDVLEASIELTNEEDKYEYYCEVLQPLIGLQTELPILLSEYSFYHEDDIKHYLDLLTHYDEYFDELIAYEEEKSKQGLFMNDTAADAVIKECKTFAQNTEDNCLIATFNSRIKEVDALSEEQISAYKKENFDAVTNIIVPAYQKLINCLTSLKGTSKNDGGLCNFKQGKDYYEYLVKSATGCNDSISNLEDRVYNKLLNDIEQMRSLMKKDASLSSQSNNFSFSLTDPKEILNSLKNSIPADFPEISTDISYQIKYVPESLQDSVSPAFYLSPPIDRLQENTIYINNSSSQTDNSSLYATLAHEGFPGHLYQTVYSSEHQSTPLRSILNWIGYSEGWATYSEYYSYSLAATKNNENLYQLMQINDSITLAIYSLLDLYIHYENWDLEKTYDFLANFYELNDATANEIYQAILSRPTNYLEYYIGYLEILRLKESAMNTLGNNFSLKSFHTFILDMGESPFWIIEKHMPAWIATQQ